MSEVWTFARSSWSFKASKRVTGTSLPSALTALMIFYFGHQSHGSCKRCLWSCDILQKHHHSDVIIGAFEKQQVAINRKQQVKQCWAFVPVCEPSLKEPQRWERARRTAFSHQLEKAAFLRGSSSSGKAGRKKKKEGRMTCQMPCCLVYWHAQRAPEGPLYCTVNQPKVWWIIGLLHQSPDNKLVMSRCLVNIQSQQIIYMK